MKLTKYQHACFVIEKDGSTLVVDPGDFTHDFIVPRNVEVVVVTHEHQDHLDPKHMQAILDANPKATVIAHETIAGRYTNYATIGAKVGEPYTVGPFTLRFFGGAHASISESVTPPPNLGVLINDRLYYPGDSFVAPEGVQVKELALPAAAPWLKISDSMDFLAKVKPEFAFPTHDEILSSDGKILVDSMLGAVASGQNTKYHRLDGQAIELS